MKKWALVFSCVISLAVFFPMDFAAAAPAKKKVKVKLDERAEKMKDVLVLYNQGKYAATVEALDKLPRGTKEEQGATLYWKALCQFKLNEFVDAAKNFEAAARLGTVPEDLYYTLGQSYYAAQKLPEARAAFAKSVQRKYKEMASLYYSAYILQTLEKKKSAAELYMRIQKYPDDPDKVKQPALFQIAEMRYEVVSEKKVTKRALEYYEEKLIPFYEKIRDMDDTSPTFKEAEKKLGEIKALIAKNTPKSPWTTRATFEFTYDSNVVTKADESTATSISHQDSFVFKPTLRTNYAKKLSKYWSLDAGMRAAGKIHTRRHTAAVYKNDNFTFEPSLTAEQSHKAFSKPGTLYFTYEFNYQLQDWKQNHDFLMYSRSHNLEVGERANPFTFGESTLKANLKLYESYTPGQNSVQPGIDYNQKFALWGNKLSTTLAVDWLFGRLTTQDTVTYKFNNRYPMDVTDTFNVTPKFNLSIVDTRFQRARGWERKLNPGLTLRKTKGNKIYKLSYDYTRNLSHDKANQQYRRHEVGLSFEYRF